MSAASTWEIALNSALGKLDGDVRMIATAARELGFSDLAVTVAHTVRVRTLEPRHRDPFDRLLVAQSHEVGLTIVTHDAAFALYPAPVLWR